MRDNFRVERKKQHSQIKSGSDSSALFKRKWVYMDQMLFLKDITDSAPMTGSLSPVAGPSHVDAVDVVTLPSEETTIHQISDPALEADVEAPPADASVQSHVSKTPSNRPGRSNHRRTTETNDFLAIEKEKVELLRANADLKMDGDYNFLVSFLPIMRKMTDMQKLQFRVKMSELALNICNTSSSTASTPSTSWSLGLNESSVILPEETQATESILTYFVEENEQI